MIDETDFQILNILQQNARTSNAEIARQIDMAPSAVLERIRRLEAKGVIQGYEARINPEALGLGLLSFVFVRSNDLSSDTRTAAALAAIPEVQEVHHIAGEDCFVLKVRSRDAKSLGRLLRERISSIGTVQSTRTTVVLETMRESAQLPLEIPRETAVEVLHD
jgi:Lrp/AsnC family transcriptional regulator, leucine-responsive regulatory protein